jgi:hypothetical protein
MSKNAKPFKASENSLDSMKRWLDEGRDPAVIVHLCFRLEKLIRALRHRAERVKLLHRYPDTQGDEWKEGK